MSVTEINKTSATIWPLWLTVGRLELNRPVTLDEIGELLMMHDPTKVKDDIAISPNDQIMAARRIAYLVSAANPSGGWQAGMSLGKAIQQRMRRRWLQVVRCGAVKPAPHFLGTHR